MSNTINGRFNFIHAAFFIMALVLAAQPVCAAVTQVTNTTDSGAGSLRNSFSFANTNAGSDEIIFNGASGLNNTTITLGSNVLSQNGLTTLNTSFLLSGGSPDGITLTITGSTIDLGAVDSLNTYGNIVINSNIIGSSGALSLRADTVNGHVATVTLGGTVSVSGGVVLNDSVTLQAASAASLGTNYVGFFGTNSVFKPTASYTLTQKLLMFADGTIDTGAFNTTISNEYNGTGVLTKIGSGTLTFSSGSSVNSGGIIINAGTVVASNAAAIGTGTITLNGGSFKAGAAGLTFSNAFAIGAGGGTIDTNNNTMTVSTAITGTGAIVKQGTGTLILSGNNTYSGGTTIAGGTLSLQSSTAAGTGTITTTGSVINYADTVNLSNPININSNTTQVQVLTGTATQSGVISETGGPRPLEKIGGGTLIFAASNTYSGGTTLTAGTARAGTNSAFGSGSINMNGGILDASADVTLANNIVLTSGPAVYANGHNVVLSGIISGSTFLHVQDYSAVGASITLSGANTYTGVTLLDSVTLKISNVNNLGASLGNMTTGDLRMDNATLKTLASVTFNKTIGLSDTGPTIIDTNGFNSTFSGVILDATGGHVGSLTKAGAGTLTLSAADTYTGATSITGGTLALSGAGNITSTSTIDISSGATFDISAASGARSFGKLSGAGNIALGANNLTTTFSSPTTSVYSGTISGTASLIKAGTGTLTLTGSSNNTGGITVSAGVLNVGSGGTSGSVSGAIVDNASLIFNRSDAYTYNNAISGTGTVAQSGSGTTTLNGFNSYTGVTTVNTGTLQVGDSAHATATIAGDVNVVGGTLTGYGTIGGNVTNGANVTPAQLSTLAVSGNYTQSSAGTLAIEVSPATASKLTVGGTASLNGTLALTFDAGTYAGKTYTILTATNVTGTFATVTASAPSGFILKPVAYGAGAVTFDLAAVAVTPTPTPIPRPSPAPSPDLTPSPSPDPTPAPTAPTGVSELGSSVSSTITSSNQASGTIFDHLGDANSGASGTETGGASSERDTLTFASLTNKSLSNSENTQEGLNGLAKALPVVAKRNGGWFKGTGNLSSIESSGAQAGFSSETGGFLFGFDREVDKGVRVGAAGGYDHTSVSTFNGVNASSETNTMRFALYGSKQFADAVTLDMQVGYARHMIDGDRLETNNGATARNSHDANEVSSGFQVSKTFDVNGIHVKPKLGMNYAHVNEDGYTETGAGLFNATIASKSINSLRLSTGVGISKHITTLDGFAFTPEARIKYSYEAWDSSVATNGSQRGIGFSSSGLTPSRNIFTVGAGFSANLNDDWSAFGNYDVDMPTANSFEQTFTMGMRYSF